MKDCFRDAGKYVDKLVLLVLLVHSSFRFISHVLLALGTPLKKHMPGGIQWHSRRRLDPK